MLLHLPLGVLGALALVELWGLVSRRPVPRSTRLLLVWLLATSAVVAALTGWQLAKEPGYVGQTIEVHRWLAVVTTGGPPNRHRATTTTAPRRTASSSSTITLSRWRCASRVAVAPQLRRSAKRRNIRNHVVSWRIGAVRWDPDGGGVGLRGRRLQ